MDGHVPSELHRKWVDPVNVTRLKPCGLNGSQKDTKGIYFLPDETGMVRGAYMAYGHPVGGCGGASVGPPAKNKTPRGSREQRGAKKYSRNKWVRGVFVPPMGPSVVWVFFFFF